MDDEVDLARARRILDAIGAGNEIAGARLHSEPVKNSLAKRCFGSFAKVRRDFDVTRSKCSLQSSLELALGIGRIKFGARDSNPRPAARRPGANIGSNTPVGAKRKANEILAKRLAPAENACALGPVPVVILFVRIARVRSKIGWHRRGFGGAIATPRRARRSS